ncbi:DUF3822 family protein [Petrimonas sp.]|uniref:DUF3822 family protein n=1 Tax=Petrimonas sp. TaxID=2023866 RepID=UPI003F510276
MFLPENIDLAQSEKYILSIRLTPDGFSFCIFSPSDKSIFHYHSTVFSKNLPAIENIKKTFFEVNFFTHPFRKTLVTVVSPRFTTVPHAYFDKAIGNDIFAFNFHGNSGKVLSNHVAESSCHVLFDMDEEIYSFLSRNLWNPSFFSYKSHLLPFFSTHRVENGQNRCFVDFHDNLVSVTCFSGDKLLSSNAYLNNDKFDALYNIVNVWEKQQLDQNSDLLILSGNLADNKESIDTLKKLIKNVETLKLDAPENYGYIPTDVLLAVSERR